jgi:hypothetical protein
MLNLVKIDQDVAMLHNPLNATKKISRSESTVTSAVSNFHA